MEKVTLKLFEFYNLEAELNGVTNQQTGETILNGLLNEKIKLTTKYWLTDLVKKVSEEKQSIEKLKEELVKRYGTVDENGNISIPVYNSVERDEEGKITSAEPNPKYLEFQNDFNKLLQEERELEYRAFSLSDFDLVESNDNYSTFFKLIKVDE
jgi:hypothetical protein